jgi:hypothetical protein
LEGGAYWTASSKFSGLTADSLKSCFHSKSRLKILTSNKFL